MSAPGPRPAANRYSRHRHSRHRHAVSALRQRGWGLLLALPLGLAAPAWAGALATRVELQVLGLDCSLCIQGLEQRLRSLPGAQQVKLDLEHGRLSLLFRPGSAVADQTLRTLMRNAGFVVRQIRRNGVAP